MMVLREPPPPYDPGQKPGWHFDEAGQIPDIDDTFTDMTQVPGNNPSRKSFLARPRLVWWLTWISFAALLYFFIGYVVLDDVYRYPAVSAIYELLWAPMFLAIAVVPILSIAVLVKGGSQKRRALVPLALIIAAIVILAAA
ncbi:MAG: hypothetical protein JWP27_2475 [Flaviaesturariibacter sp.]|nr:hypothetical protein [Flaviaesturariibacter sp.]